MQRQTEGTSLYEVQNFVTGRDTEFETFLEPGQYVILPRTNGITLKKPSTAKGEVSKLLEESGNISDLLEGAIEDIYYRFDTMITNSIDFQEFKDFYDTVGQPIQQAEFDS